MIVNNMDTIWELVDGFFSAWNSRSYEGEMVFFGESSYPKSLGNKEVARRLMLELNPELCYVFNPTVAAYSLVEGYDKNKINEIKPLAEFNPFKIIKVLGEIGLTEYKDNKMILKKDDSKLPEFYQKLYQKILPKDADPKFVFNLSLPQLQEAYNFLKDEGYIRLWYNYGTVKKLLNEREGPIKLTEYLDFSRYKKYGAFGEGWENSLKGVDDIDAQAEKICEELVKYDFWAKTPEDEFLEKRSIDLTGFPERKKNHEIFEVLQFLSYFGITMLREEKSLDDNSIVSSSVDFGDGNTSVIPKDEEHIKNWKKAYNNGKFEAYINLISPKVVFPYLNLVFNEFFSWVMGKI